MKRFVILTLCVLMLLSLTACAAGDKGPNPEFQQMMERYGITDLITEPVLENDEREAKYIQYFDGPDIPYVEVITFVYSQKTDEITGVSYDYFYLLEGLGLSQEEEKAGFESMLSYAEENMGVGLIWIRGRYLPDLHFACINVSCFTVNTLLSRMNLQTAGYLDSTDPVSFKASDKSLLNDGYIKQ